MSEHTSRGVDEPPIGPLDSESVTRIDTHLKRAVNAEERSEKDFHVRHARQLLQVCRDR